MKALCNPFRVSLVATALMFPLLPSAYVRAQAPAAPPAQPDAGANQTQPSDDDATGNATDRTHQTVAQNTADAWNILKTAASDPKKPDLRSQAVAAAGTIQGSALAGKIVSDGLADSSIDVRIAAIQAEGTLKDHALQNKLREMLDDHEPAIAFTAATTLWKMNDKSGEDILTAVVDGDRKTDAGLIRNSEREADKDLHSPTKLAEIGARQGAGYLLGPFGIGLTAWDYTHQHPAINPRVTAVNLLAEEKTPRAHETLMNALQDKDPQVRAASARALGEFRDHETAAHLLDSFNDGKISVRLLCAASYIRVTGGGTTHHLFIKK